MRTGILNFQEAREALEQLYESSDLKRRFTLRLYVLYAYNDMYGRSGVIPLDGSEDQLFFEENCREMIRMERTIPTLRAELYREIGEFEKCVEYLDSLEPAGEHENKVRELIKERALIGDRTVFRL